MLDRVAELLSASVQKSEILDLCLGERSRNPFFGRSHIFLVVTHTYLFQLS